MKLKDLYKKYDKDYSICVFGKPLEEKTIPFTFLPHDREERMNMEVVEMEIKEKEHTEYGVSFKTMKAIKPIHRKGYINVYVKKVG